MVDLWRDFWICETGTGQEVTQLHERYDDDYLFIYMKYPLIPNSKNFVEMKDHVYSLYVLIISFR